MIIGSILGTITAIVVAMAWAEMLEIEEALCKEQCPKWLWPYL